MSSIVEADDAVSDVRTEPAVICTALLADAFDFQAKKKRPPRYCSGDFPFNSCAHAGLDGPAAYGEWYCMLRTAI